MTQPTVLHDVLYVREAGPYLFRTGSYSIPLVCEDDCYYFCSVIDEPPPIVLRSRGDRFRQQWVPEAAYLPGTQGSYVLKVC